MDDVCINDVDYDVGNVIAGVQNGKGAADGQIVLVLSDGIKYFHNHCTFSAGMSIIMQSINSPQRPAMSGSVITSPSVIWRRRVLVKFMV